MAVGTALSRVTGLGRMAALVFALGVAESRLGDAYNIANTLPNVIYELVLGGVLTSVFIPILVEELRTRDHDDAWESASTLVSTSMAVLVALSAVTVVLAPWIVGLFSSRLSGAAAATQRDLATFLLRFFALQIALYGFSAIAGGLLNAYDRFAVPMFAPILNNVVVIATFIVFALVVSGTPTDASVNADLGSKLLLALGTTAGVGAMAAVHWPFVRRLPGRLRVRVNFRHPAVRKLARLSGWTLLYVLVNQVGFGIALYLANGERGGPTAYFTAFAFFQLPYGIVAVSIMTALLPTLSGQYVAGDTEGFRSRTAAGLRATALLLVPATAAYLVLAKPLVQTLLEHGVARGASSNLVAEVLQMFAIGILPFAAFLLFNRAFYARQDTRTPLVLNVVDNVVTVALDFALFPSMGVSGLALAHSLGYVVATGVAVVLLSRRLGGLESRHTTGELTKVVLASGVATLAMVAVTTGVQEVIDTGGGRALAQLVAGSVIGGGAFLLAALTLRVEDLAVLSRLVPGRRR